MTAALTRDNAKPGTPLAAIGGLPPIRTDGGHFSRGALHHIEVIQKPILDQTTAERYTEATAAALAQVQNVSPSLARVLRPQAAYRWLLPYLANITPTYVEGILRGALAGNHVQAWELFDLMIDTDPEVASCVGEYIDGALKKQLVIEPYHDENEKPSPLAIENAKIVSAAFHKMRPDPAADENAIAGTIRDILFARFHGQAVLEEDLFDVQQKNLFQVPINGIGNVVIPRCSYWCHPVVYAWSMGGRLGLRVALADQIKELSDYAKASKPGSRPSDIFGTSSSIGPANPTDLAHADPSVWNWISSQPMPSQLMEFPPNKFLISIYKAKAGSALGGSCLRPLAWWWVVRNFCGDWLLDNAQIFGMPLRVAKYQQGLPETEKAETRDMLQNMGSRAWALLDERVTIQFEKAMESGTSSPGGFMMELAGQQIRKVILRQTMSGGHGTTGKGGGQAFGEVEADTKHDCIQGGANLAAEVLREQKARHVLMLNRGNDNELPFIRLSEHEEGGLEDAQIIQTLAGAGFAGEIGVNHLHRYFKIPIPEDHEKTLADGAAAAAAAAAPPAGPGGKEAGGSKIENGKTPPAGPQEKQQEDEEELAASLELEAHGGFITMDGHVVFVGPEKDETDGGARETLTSADLKAGDKVVLRGSNWTQDRHEGTVEKVDTRHVHVRSQHDAWKAMQLSTAANIKAHPGRKAELQQKLDTFQKQVEQYPVYKYAHDRVAEVHRGGKIYKADWDQPSKLNRVPPKMVGASAELAAEVVGRVPSPGAAPVATHAAGSGDPAYIAKAYTESLAPLLKYLRAGLKLPANAQLHYFQRAIQRWPELTAPLKHDDSAAQLLTAHLVEQFLAGLAGKSTGAAVTAGDIPGHEFHGNQYAESAAMAESKTAAARNHDSATAHLAARDAHQSAAGLAVDELHKGYHQKMSAHHQEMADILSVHEAKMVDLAKQRDAELAPLKKEIASTRSQISTTNKRAASMLRALRQEAGDAPGHDFRGNQYTKAVGQVKDVLSGKLDEAAYAPVSDSVADKIKAVTGRDVSGFHHFVDHAALVHIDQQHGVGKEDQPDHEPVTHDDIGKIPMIVAQPHTIEKGQTARGLPAVKYSKRFNGTTYFVEEEWAKEKMLAAKTMYKMKAAK